MNRLKCIYAILDSNRNLDLDIKGLDGFSVNTLAYKDISAAVSDIEKDDLKVNKECALSYGRIIESIMERCTLLPVRFGTLVKSDREVIGLLEEYYDDFVINLRQVKGKLEYGLKVLWDVEKVNLQIMVLSGKEDSKSLDQLKGDSPYKGYLLKKLKEHKLEEALVKKAQEIIEDIHKPLAELSFLNKFKKMTTKKIILDAAYLVEKEKKDVFVQGFKELSERRQDLKFLLTGPWPPYNFIESSNFKKETLV
jgi:glycosyltransferase involved in cell wall biosynthesis